MSVLVTSMHTTRARMHLGRTAYRGNALSAMHDVAIKDCVLWYSAHMERQIQVSVSRAWIASSSRIYPSFAAGMALLCMHW